MQVYVFVLALVLLQCISLSFATSCGKRPAGARIVGGEEAIPNSWPWQLSLRKYGRHNCGASLITPEWALTAGHCVRRTQSASAYSVVAGAHYRVNDPNSVEYKISKVIMHKNYDMQVGNDVALLKLAKPAVLNNKVGTICLPKQGDRVPGGKKCWMTGWGRFNPNTNQGAPKLKQTFVPIANHQTCRRVNGGEVIENQMVCAGGTGTSVCNGDSGGPLSCEENGRWVLRGAASWVTDLKCPGDAYSVYARVSEYIDWVHKTMKDNGGGGSGGSGGGASCKDNSSNCSYYKHWCSWNSNIRKRCKKTCGICKS